MDKNIIEPSPKKNWAYIFSPCIIVGIIFIMVLICMVVLRLTGKEMAEPIYVLLLLMPFIVGSLLMDVFLRTLFRKSMKYQVPYIWVIEVVALVLCFRAFILVFN